MKPWETALPLVIVLALLVPVFSCAYWSVVPKPTETATLHETRSSLYTQLLGFLTALGAAGQQPAPVLGNVEFLPGECETEPLPRTMARGYYTTMLMTNVAIPGADQHAAFRALREQAERDGFEIRGYRNPPTRPVPTREGEPGYELAHEWSVSGARSGESDMTFAFYTVQPQTTGLVTITSGCRRTPDPGEVYDYFYITDLPPTLPPATFHPPPRNTAMPPLGPTRTASAGPTAPPSMPPPRPSTPPSQPAQTEPAQAEPAQAEPPDDRPPNPFRDILG